MLKTKLKKKVVHSRHPVARPKAEAVSEKRAVNFAKQDFQMVDDRILDSKGRITIAQEWLLNTSNPTRSFKVFRNSEGDLLLRPEVSIPAREAWLFSNPAMAASLHRGIGQIEAGKGEIVEGLNDFLNKL